MDTIEHRQKLGLKNKISEAPVPRDYESRNRERCKVQARQCQQAAQLWKLGSRVDSLELYAKSTGCLVGTLNMLQGQGDIKADSFSSEI